MNDINKRPTMWVCRAGSESIYYDMYIEQGRIFLPWDGFRVPLDTLDNMQSLRNLVITEKGDGPRTSISNLAGQLFYFTYSMDIHDYILIPQYHSRAYTIASLTGVYEYDASNKLCHSRQVKVLKRNIPRDIFSQNVIYSLGAYRTLFRVKQCGEVLTTIKKWAKENSRG